MAEAARTLPGLGSLPITRPEPAAAETSRAARHPILEHLPLLLVLMLGIVMSFLNQTAITIAIPRILNDFSISPSTGQWLVSGYLLASGVLVPLSAYLIETFGTRILFALAMLAFTVGSAVCAVAPTFQVLLVGRVIQALGGGVMMPLVMTTFLMLFPPESRGRSMGILGVGFIFAPAVGPTLAGWVVEYSSWRLLFAGMVPFGLLDIVLGFLFVKDVARHQKPPLDVLSVVAAIGGFSALLYGLSEAGTDGWGSAQVALSLALGVIGVTVFVVRQLTATKPMLDLRVFKFDIFAITNILNALLTVAMFAALFLLPIYLQSLRGFTPLQAGLLLLPGALAMGLLMPIAGALFDHVGPRPVAMTGLAITAITTWGFTRLSLETGYGYLLLLYILRSCGMGMMMMTIMTAGLNQLPRALNSHGTAVTNTVRMVAGSLGIALLVTIFSDRFQFHLGGYQAAATTMDPAVASSFNGATQIAASALHVPAQLAQGFLTILLYGNTAQQAAVDAINDAFVWAAAFAVLGLVMSVFLRDVRRDAAAVPATVGTGRVELVARGWPTSAATYAAPTVDTRQLVAVNSTANRSATLPALWQALGAQPGPRPPESIPLPPTDDPMPALAAELVRVELVVRRLESGVLEFSDNGRRGLLCVVDREARAAWFREEGREVIGEEAQRELLQWSAGTIEARMLRAEQADAISWLWSLPALCHGMPLEWIQTKTLLAQLRSQLGQLAVWLQVPEEPAVAFFRDGRALLAYSSLRPVLGQNDFETLMQRSGTVTVRWSGESTGAVYRLPAATIADGREN